jgi:ectoine hydroxylase-related dioxygenase (phytanoyl-CoA dioxygenase family)
MDEHSASTFFKAHGYVIIEQAISHTLADAIKISLQGGDDGGHLIGMSRRHLVAASADQVRDAKFRYKDLYVNHALVRNAIFSDAIIGFLSAQGKAPVLAFQNLGFLRGSGLRIHRDSNYVDITGLNAHFYGCWIALEDVEEGAGELIYYPGSHELPPYQFAENSTHWVVSRDGIYANEACHGWLEKQMSSRHIMPEKFLARKGDCIIWHGDLVHAGSPILKPGSTRYSLVTHFCSAQSRPRYLQDTDNEQLVRFNECCYLSSAHYDLGGIQTTEQLDCLQIRPRLSGATEG